MSSGNAPVPSVLDSTASGVAESSGLGLVSALLEVKALWRGMNGIKLKGRFYFRSLTWKGMLELEKRLWSREAGA